MSRLENAPLNSRERFQKKERLESSPIRVMLEIVNQEQIGAFISLWQVEKVRKELLYDAYQLVLYGVGESSFHPDLEALIKICNLNERDWELEIFLITQGTMIPPDFPFQRVCCLPDMAELSPPCGYTTLSIGLLGTIKSPCQCANFEREGLGNFRNLWNCEEYISIRQHCRRICD